MSGTTCSYCGLDASRCTSHECITIEQVNGWAGYGWYWWDTDYQDEGVCGTFLSKKAALAHATGLPGVTR